MKKLLILAVLFLTACSQLVAAPTPTPPPTPTLVPPTATLPPATATLPAPTATHAVPPVAPTALPTPSEPTDFTFAAPDGVQLAVAYYPPIVRPAPAVLLLHMLGRSKADWDSFARSLQKQGYAVMAMDLRGHGASAGPVDWTKADDDTLAAWQTLTARPEVDANRTAIVGASIGSNLALIAGATESRIKAVVALSPGEDYMGLKPGDTIANFGERPLLLVASADDAYSFDSIQKLAPRALAAEKKEFTNAGHGTAMFADPTLEPSLIEWLNKNVRDLK
ncbi:MAG: alpha/beta fold hydrolase [Chloroflexi bacterium]|nr:alpha/beta fold hydrolase [Chloroflexota bacterium]